MLDFQDFSNVPENSAKQVKETLLHFIWYFQVVLNESISSKIISTTSGCRICVFFIRFCFVKLQWILIPPPEFYQVDPFAFIFTDWVPHSHSTSCYIDFEANAFKLRISYQSQKWIANYNLPLGSCNKARILVCFEFFSSSWTLSFQNENTHLSSIASSSVTI